MMRLLFGSCIHYLICLVLGAVVGRRLTMKTNNDDVGVPVAGHFFLALYFAGGFGVLRLLLERSVQALADRKTPREGRLKSKRIARFTESIWKLVYYGAMEMWILVVSGRESFSSDACAFFFEGWPDQKLKYSVKLYYMCQCGFYLLSIVFLVAWEAPRKDFTVMMSHHIVTTVLITLSYFTRFFRIGTVILMLHDASDVFLEAAKLFKYSDVEMGANICFILFALSWLILRLILFPLWVIKCTSYDVLKEPSVPNFALFYSVFNTMLIALLVLHIYWWSLICTMVFRQIKNRGQVGSDIRSDSEEEDDEHDKNE